MKVKLFRQAGLDEAFIRSMKKRFQGMSLELRNKVYNEIRDIIKLKRKIS